MIHQKNTVSRKQEKRFRNSSMNPIQLFFLNVLIILTAVWLLFGFVFRFLTVPNEDMNPSLKAGDLLLCYQLQKDIRAQDVVAVRKNDTIYIGRVVAVPGDIVEISDKETLIINGNTMLENNIFSATPRFEGFISYPLTLSESEYFILADARNGCEDSRYYGAVQKNEIQGKIITVLRRNHL
ncbi:MAG: signal peptidase I [Oscillospiraceae bacterium]|nr:signal peptidase I [Oscillospiraceae bacterium]